MHFITYYDAYQVPPKMMPMEAIVVATLLCMFIPFRPCSSFLLQTPKQQLLLLPKLTATTTSTSSGCCASSARRHSTTTTMATTTTTADTETKEENPLVELGLPSPLILGSASFTRKLILKEMGIPYHIVVREIDEKNVGCRIQDTPEALVAQIANAKADRIIHEFKNGGTVMASATSASDASPVALSPSDQEYILLTGDQVVTCDGKILEKPHDIQQAKEFIRYYGSHPCSTVGCVCLTHWPSQIRVTGLHIATITFRSTITDDADDIVHQLVHEERAPILSCAGGLMIEHPITQRYVHHIDGTQDSVMGLCKQTVLDLLRELKETISASK
jgi:septum formation protein